jgi:hypothetical protein
LFRGVRLDEASLKSGRYDVIVRAGFVPLRIGDCDFSVLEVQLVRINQPGVAPSKEIIGTFRDEGADGRGVTYESRRGGSTLLEPENIDYAYLRIIQTILSLRER